MHATRGNFNNDIGLPLTLLDFDHRPQRPGVGDGRESCGRDRLPDRHSKAYGGIGYQRRPCPPRSFGSLAGVAKAKGELFATMPRQGTAIINRDDEFAPLWRTLAEGCDVMEYGRSEGADCWLTAETDAGARGQRFRLVVSDVGVAEVELHCKGAITR